jgi:hypothetical protein
MTAAIQSPITASTTTVAVSMSVPPSKRNTWTHESTCAGLLPIRVGSFSGYASTRLVLQLYIDDGEWLVAYARTHLTPDIAVLLDEWVIGTVHPQVAVDHGLTAPTQPFALETNEVKTSMAAAITTAASTYEPWILEPITAST